MWYYPPKMAKSFVSTISPVRGDDFPCFVYQTECQILQNHEMTVHVILFITALNKYHFSPMIGFPKVKVRLLFREDFVVEYVSSRRNIWGQGDMCYKSLGLSWSRFVNISAARRKRMY